MAVLQSSGLTYICLSMFGISHLSCETNVLSCSSYFLFPVIARPVPAMLRVVISLKRYQLESQLIEKPGFQVKVYMYLTFNKCEVHLNPKFERKSLKF